MRYDVFGMCNALVDLQAEVSDESVEALGFPKGSMSLVDLDQQRAARESVRSSVINVEAGGSGSNTMQGLALLGAKTAFTSRIGRDDLGPEFVQSLRTKGVEPLLATGEGGTGVCFVMVHPDAQRTMLTYLGECRNLRPEDVREDRLRESRILYVTGYLWDTDSQKEAVMRAMSAAHKAGVRVALSLSDTFCVQRHRRDFERLVRERVDVVFGNDQEAMLLTGAGSAEEAARALGAMAEVAVVTEGACGSMIFAEGELHRAPAMPVKALDATGAGDMYAAGALYGMLRGLPYGETARIAAYGAAQVVAKMGPRLESLDLSAMPGPDQDLQDL
jgi:sugar/nucleoside kinase (ribokinase family)